MQFSSLPKINIVLVEPEIPPNTGNIARLAVGVGAVLHLVGKLGFRTDDKAVKRAGLDYWDHLDLHFHDSLAGLIGQYPQGRFFFATKRGKHLYTEIRYREEDFIVFGKETQGLPDEIVTAHADRTIAIPMIGPMRSLNLANAVSVVTYEVVRQLMQRPSNLSQDGDFLRGDGPA